MDDKTTIEEVKKLIVKFRDERDWKMRKLKNKRISSKRSRNFRFVETPV